MNNEKFLNNIESDCNVSIYTPIYNSQDQTDNESKLNKLRKNVMDHLNKFDLDESRSIAILSHFDEFISNNKRFNYPIKSLVLFFSEKGIFAKTFEAELPLSQIFVNEKFELDKFNQFESKVNDHYILKLFQDEAKLYESRSGNLNEISLPELNKTFKAFYKDIEIIQNLQFHVTASGAETIMNHGHKDEYNFLSDRLRKFVKNIEAEVSAYLKSKKAKSPLILASSQEITGIYRDYNSYENLLENVLKINRKHTSVNELGEKAIKELENSK